jgi:hypothetical protein
VYLADLGHVVTVLEQAPSLGGSLGTFARDGYTFDTGEPTLTLPAVFSDLFRVTGRPLERELGLVPVEPRVIRSPADRERETGFQAELSGSRSPGCGRVGSGRVTVRRSKGSTSWGRGDAPGAGAGVRSPVGNHHGRLDRPGNLTGWVRPTSGPRPADDDGSRNLLLPALET